MQQQIVQFDSLKETLAAALVEYWLANVPFQYLFTIFILLQ
jgi:hypothetical protein